MAPVDDTPTGMPPMIGKRLTIAEWSEYVRSYQWGALRPTRLVLHHTYIPTEKQWRGLASMRAMQRYYAGLGWTAAPHIYCGPDGIWLFTPLREIGIHAGTGNGSARQGWYSLGLEMVGNFDAAKPQGAVWDNARAVMGLLAYVLDIAPRQLISFHRDYTRVKSCPGRAVEKEWVFGEVEAWMAANLAAIAAPPVPAEPAPPESLPLPPNVGELVEQLLHETYRHRSQGYNTGWAFHQWATQHDLGAPVGKSKQVRRGGTSWNYQSFGRDVLFCEVPHWSDVHSLQRERAGSSNAGAVAVLVEAIFRDVGLTYRPGDPLHAAASSLAAGPPLGQKENLLVGARRYRALVCAADTLYVAQGESAVGKYSELHAGAGTQALRAALAALAYAVGRVPYKADSAFVRTADQARLGAPLSDVYPVRSSSGSYMLQVFALDTLLAADVSGSAMRRLSDLRRGAASPVQSKGVSVPICPDWYGPPRWLPSAGRGVWRGATRIDQIVLAVARRDAAGELDALGEGGGDTHYLVTLEGEVLQLLDDEAMPESEELNGSLETAIVVGVENPPAVTPGSARPRLQIDVVARLLAELRARHAIPQERVRKYRARELSTGG